MKLVLLAAGKSSRIYQDIGYNKCLIEVRGKSLIRHIIDNAILNGINDISIVLGYKSRNIIDHLSEYNNLKFIYNKKYRSTDMVYSACLSLKNNKSDVLVSYTDIFYEKKIFKIIKKQKLKNITLPFLKNWKKVWKLRNKNIFDDAETFFQKNNKLTEIGQKINRKNLNLVKGQFMGLIYIPKTQISFIKKFYNDNSNENKIQFTGFLNKLIKKKIDIKCLEYNGFWYEIDDKNDLNNMKI